MNIRYSRFTLTPKKRLNRLSSMSSIEGVYLSTEVQGKQVFAEYFPHVPLGDDSVTGLLDTFKAQKTEYQRKVLRLLSDDARYQQFPSKKFYNHQLWSGSEPIVAPVIKYKMLHVHDQIFHEALKNGVRIRLDANAVFNSENVHHFLDAIRPEWKFLIEYVEDPLSGTDWSSFPYRRARDWISGSPYEIYIYKPVCEMLPEFRNLIFSAYLGSALSNWHTYCELLENGNTQIVQGIIAPGYYEEVKDFYLGDYENGFSPDLAMINDLYRELSQREWKTLCSM